MKITHKVILGSLILIGLQFGLSGCVADVGVEGPGVYYGGGPWFHDGPWVDGGYWGGGHWGGGGYIHPHRR
jgi:hypothetical protein